MYSNFSQVKEGIYQEIKGSTNPLTSLYVLSDIVIKNTALHPDCYSFIYKVNHYVKGLHKTWYSFVLYCRVNGKIHFYFHESVYPSEKECFKQAKYFLFNFPYFGFLKRCEL